MAKPLDALSEGNLYIRKSDNAVFMVREDGAGFALLDPLTGADAGAASKGDLIKVKVSNGVRRVIREVTGSLTLGGPDPAARLVAADTLFQTPDPAAIPALDAAILNETDAKVKARMEAARAAAVLVSELDDGQKGVQ